MVSASLLHSIMRWAREHLYDTFLIPQARRMTWFVLMDFKLRFNEGDLFPYRAHGCSLLAQAWSSLLLPPLTHCDLGPVPISDKSAYRKISWSLVAARLIVSKHKSRGFETSRDLTIRRLIGYWNGAQHSADCADAIIKCTFINGQIYTLNKIVDWEMRSMGQ